MDQFSDGLFTPAQETSRETAEDRKFKAVKSSFEIVQGTIPWPV